MRAFPDHEPRGKEPAVDLDGHPARSMALDELVHAHQAPVRGHERLAGEAWVRRFDEADLGSGIGGARVDAVDEDEAGIARAPRRAHDAIEDLLRRQSRHRHARPRVDEVVVPARLEGGHERIGDGDRDVEVGHGAVELALDELQDVRMVDAQHAHVGAAAGAPLLHRLRRAVEDLEKGHGARGPAARRADEVVLRPETREREARAPARLVDDGRGLDGVEDLLHRVAHGEDVAGGVLELVVLARVHQRGRVGQELPLDHHVVEGGGDLLGGGRAPTEARLGVGDGARHTPAHLLRGLDDLPLPAGEVALGQHAQRGL